VKILGVPIASGKTYSALGQAIQDMELVYPLAMAILVPVEIQLILRLPVKI
jgi:hypothetical protein